MTEAHSDMLNKEIVSKTQRLSIDDVQPDKDITTDAKDKAGMTDPPASTDPTSDPSVAQITASPTTHPQIGATQTVTTPSKKRPFDKISNVEMSEEAKEEKEEETSASKKIKVQDGEAQLSGEKEVNKDQKEGLETKEVKEIKEAEILEGDKEVKEVEKEMENKDAKESIEEKEIKEPTKVNEISETNLEKKLDTEDKQDLVASEKAPTTMEPK